MIILVNIEITIIQTTIFEFEIMMPLFSISLQQNKMFQIHSICMEIDKNIEITINLINCTACCETRRGFEALRAQSANTWTNRVLEQKSCQHCRRHWLASTCIVTGSAGIHMPYMVTLRQKQWLPK